MKKCMKGVLAMMAAFAVAFMAPLVSSAHEVYVLNKDEIAIAMNSQRPDFLATIASHLGQFLGWGLLVITIIAVVFFVSISRPIERLCDPVLGHLKKWAPRMAQVTLGSALLAGAYYGAIFGVELPLSAAFGPFAPLVVWILAILGAMLVIGILPRVAGMAVTAIFAALAVEHGAYMLNYATYLGEGLTLALFGGAYTAYSSGSLSKIFHRKLVERSEPYKYLIMRSLFGLSLIYASLYAKLIYGGLALMVVMKYNLTHYFPFDPIFLVFGAMIIEVLIGLSFIIGFEVRFTAIFFLVFLTLSVAFFGESVWPHIILAGTAISTFMHGYDKFSLSWRAEGTMRKGKAMEPVL